MTTWRGAQMFKSADGGSTYTAQETLSNAAAIGAALTALGDFAGGNIFDESSSVSIVMRTPGAVLLSATELQVLNGANVAAIGAAGRWEVIQFKNATLTAPATYRLTGLLRGRRGTEWATGLHQTSDQFVLADPAAWKLYDPGVGDIGLPRLYKGATIQTTLASATAQNFTYAGVALRPYAPVQIGGGRNAAGDVLMQWVRRTRIGGAWRDGVDVPLAEDSEAYVVEIYDSAYAVVKRTITGLTSPNATYTAANQVADFGGVQATVYVKVYQLSAMVGRGTPGVGAV